MTKFEMTTAKNALIANGWNYVCATLAGANGGLLFSRRVEGVKETFKLNDKTLSEVDLMIKYNV